MAEEDREMQSIRNNPLPLLDWTCRGQNDKRIQGGLSCSEWFPAEMGASALQSKRIEFCQEPQWVWKLTLSQSHYRSAQASWHTDFALVWPKAEPTSASDL